MTNFIEVCSIMKSTRNYIATSHTRPMKLPIKDLKQSKRQRLKITLAPQGFISIVIEYYANMASVARKTTMQSSGVFGVPIEVVAK